LPLRSVLSGPRRQTERGRRGLPAAAAFLALALALPLDGCCVDCSALSRAGAVAYTGPAATARSAPATRPADSRGARAGSTGTAGAPTQQAAVPSGAEAVGSAFYINPKGQLLTTWAVVRQCRRVAVLVDYEFQDATVIASHPLRGLAVLDSRRPTAVHAYLRTDPVAPGERITAFAHPILDGISLPLEAASGTVSSTSSPDGVYGILQSSALSDSDAVGGPIVDARGDVIGIVVPKLVAGWPGEAAYGIGNALILQFGAAAGVEIWERAGAGMGDIVPAAGAAPYAGDYTVPVICFR
jgi:S1-C subfamily serine protease